MLYQREGSRERGFSRGKDGVFFQDNKYYIFDVKNIVNTEITMSLQYA